VWRYRGGYALSNVVITEFECIYLWTSFLSCFCVKYLSQNFCKYFSRLVLSYRVSLERSRCSGTLVYQKRRVFSNTRWSSNLACFSFPHKLLKPLYVPLWSKCKFTPYKCWRHRGEVSRRAPLILNLLPRGELSYLAPLSSENISAPYFKQYFFREGGVTPPRLRQTPRLPVPRQK